MATTRAIFTLLVVAALVAPAAAQDVKIESRPLEGERERGIVVPGPKVEPTRPPDIDYYPEGTVVLHDPGFFEGVSMETETGRVGLSAWTAPNQPVGPASSVSGFREVSGWFAVGLSVTWGAPPKPVGARRPR